MTVRYDTLMNRVRHALIDGDRIKTEAEADAEINRMSNVELLEMASLAVDQIVTGLEMVE